MPVGLSLGGSRAPFGEPFSVKSHQLSEVICSGSGGCSRRVSAPPPRTRGLVAKCCAIPVWRPSFVLFLGHWPHIGPVPGATLGCLWGPGGLPTGARGPPRDNPDDPNHVLGVPLGCLWGPGGLPMGGRELPGDNRGDPKGAFRCRGAHFI